MTTVESSVYASLVNALKKMFGDANAVLIMKYLEQENVIMKGGKVDAERLDRALQSLFGQGAGRIICRLMAQKKSIPRLAS